MGWENEPRLDTWARAWAGELGFRVPGQRGSGWILGPGLGRRTGVPSARFERMGLSWLILRKLLATRVGGISCLRSRAGRRLSCSSKTAEDSPGWLPRHRQSGYCGSQAQASAESFLPRCLLRAVLGLWRLTTARAPRPSALGLLELRPSGPASIAVPRSHAVGTIAVLAEEVGCVIVRGCGRA